jgi:UDP-N-acetylmuramoylalanine--D-glutamate ligase
MDRLISAETGVPLRDVRRRQLTLEEAQQYQEAVGVIGPKVRIYETARGMDTPAAIEAAVRGFRSVPHRLELVARVDGADYYNDSIATTPERTLAGMRSFEEPLVLLLGGREKHLPLEEMSREMCRRCRAAVFFGEAREALGAAARAACTDIPPEKRPHMETVATLSEAVAAARAAARPGDVVLLSPACTSFDAYENFEERGAHFRRLILALPGAKGER